MRRSEFTALVAASLVAAPPRVAAAANAPAAPVAPLALPGGGFDESVAQIRALIARDEADPTLIRPAMPRLHVHGGPVENAVILFHGFTNCPQQFDELAMRFYASGCNVFVPRIPYHGKTDRLTWDLGELTVPKLQDFAAECYRLAVGLGRRVTAMGLSLGGSLSLWLGQIAPLHLSAPISPFLMPIGFARRPGMLAMRVLDAVPDMYWWWDPRVKAKCLPDYAYPGYPTHALTQCVFLGDAVFAQVPGKPGASRCTLVTNINEPAVNNNVAFELMDDWKSEGVAYDHYVFTDLGAPRHDIIDPTTFPQARTLVYPELVKLVVGTY